MHSLHLGGSPGAVVFGTTTIGLGQGDTLLTITLAFSNIFSSLCTHAVCFKGRV